MDHWKEHTPEKEPYIVRAEIFKDYLSGDKYYDLLTFEDDIAKISSLIVIFLESPGSIAELGIFCNMGEVNRKLIVFVPQQKVLKKRSFIYLGPLTYIKGIDDNAYKTYPWPEDDSDEDYEHIELIVDDISEILKKANDTKGFKPDNNGHLAFLIHDIISIAQPIRFTEIGQTLSAVGVIIEDKLLRRLLYLLKCLQLIDSMEYSNLDYYYPLTDRKGITFGPLSDGGAFERTKVTLQLRTFSLDNINKIINEKKRLSVYRLTNNKRGGGR